MYKRQVQVLSERRGPESMGDLLQDFLLGTRRALREAGRPSLTITLDRIDAPSVAGVLALFERAVGLYAVLANLNAYHQPGVEAGKRAARGAAALRERLLVALTKHPRTAEHLAVHCEADLSDTVDLLERLVITGRAAREDHGYRLRRPLDG